MTSYQEFVLSNERWFRGRFPESEDSIARAELKLGVTLPSDLKWLLLTYGYWHATGVCSLHATIEGTLEARANLSLPHSWVVLYDHGDGGVCLLNTLDSHEVVELSWHGVPDNLHGDTVYESLLAYSQHLIDVEGDNLDEDDIEYDPFEFNDPPPIR